MCNLSYNILSSISAEYGESFYLIDIERFESNYNDMLGAFRKYYPFTEIAYSYKTNYLPIFCRKVNELGGNAEIVSEMELYLAEKLEVPADRIYYNGPWKKREYVEHLMLSGGHINVDGFYEIKMISEIAAIHPDKTFSVGLRIAADIGQDEPSRFGFDVTNSDLERAFREISITPNLKVSGLHIHLPFRMPDTFGARMEVLEKVLKLFHGYTFDYISLGGGYMGIIPNDMKQEFPFVPPTYDDYARMVAGEFSRIATLGTKLIIEPGSALVADAMKLVTRVINIKESRNRRIATLSGSTFQMNPSVKNVKRSIKVIANGAQTDGSKDTKDIANTECKSTDMAGYTCIEGDFLYRNYKGDINEGDFVVFDNVGSYSIVMKPPFILPDIAVLAIRGGRQIECITPPQTVQNVFERILEIETNKKK